ncbi:exocyst complex component SEC10 [Suhomyces tanzawaensis NRRL Y-17324]|uniref:Exocyst complex component SEC10 n=1 Tax=Suhomyces tanzawaensis NRRL Y-17324 TaxID=984487 RepID=A0A1E4SAZ5_9ASCO|nr:exocyst complex component SEC10 [Suhomyces tanzawaensis NRRL Y-17324]ODV76697.1 exocyst complex component SEC10 [Suhomyces tanzawaensis NRRL Y-17324]
MSFSIYDLDENIRKLLNLDNFLDGLSVNDFIEELSKDHFLKGAEVNKLEYLDPKPYIRTFESTLRELKELNIESNQQREQSEKMVESYELKHSENVMQLADQIDSTVSKFDLLDSKISQVSSKINPLGQSLNKITNSRDRSLETIFLIRAYHGFYVKEKYEPLETLRLSKKYDDKIKCAKTVNNLLTLSKKIESPDLPKTTKCVNIIEKYSETMERNLLNKFEIASEDNNFEFMREIASILFEFNGGANVVQTFVSKNDLLLEAENDMEDDGEGEKEESILDNEAIWIKLSDPNFVGIIKDAPTESLLQRLRIAIKGQARIIQQVFDNPIPVLKIFIQRVYAQMIQNKVSALLQYSLSVSSLSHVRILHSLYTLVGDFTKDVKEFLTTNDFDEENELSSILDQSYYDLFIEYTSENVYFGREKKNLEDIIYELVDKFNHYNERALSNQFLSTKLETLENLDIRGNGGIASGTDHQNNDKFNFHFSERKRLNQFKTFMKSKLDRQAAVRPEDLEEQKEYSSLSITKVETILKSTIESIARVLELSPTKAPEFSLEILEILLFDFGKLYIGGGLEVAYDQLKQEASKVSSVQPFDLVYTTSFNFVSEILFLISATVKKIIVPCALNSPNIRNRMSNLTNNYISRCEKSLNLILTETLDMISGRISYILTKQKKKDFLCDTIEDDTEACEILSDFLQAIYATFSSTLNNANLNNVLVKVGINLLNQLLEHYKKFTVNSTGGIVLTKDVIRYQSIIDEWNIPDLSENFQLLKEIGNLFTVQAELISSLVTEGQLAHLKPFNVRQYVAKRADFNPSYIERFFSFKQ